MDEGSLSPTRRLRQMEIASQTQSDFNLSDSVSSLSSVSSNPPISAANYRGLSGEIAANIENLSRALQPLEKSMIANRTSSANDRSRRLEATNERPDDSAILRAIKEQMALSLRHMKDLEEQVQHIPKLNSRISDLKSEKDHLSTVLEMAKNPNAKPRVPPKPIRGERIAVSESEMSPPETPDSRPHNFTTALGKAMAESAHRQNILQEYTSGQHPNPPQPPPRSTSVDRMRQNSGVVSPAPPPPIPPKPQRTASVDTPPHPRAQWRVEGARGEMVTEGGW